VDPKAVLDAVVKGKISSPPPGIKPQNPDRPVRSPALYRLSYYSIPNFLNTFSRSLVFVLPRRLQTSKAFTSVIKILNYKWSAESKVQSYRLIKNYGVPGRTQKAYSTIAQISNPAYPVLLMSYLGSVNL
jgi:hypothetical protein